MDIKETTQQAIGQASMCWEPKPSTEVFNSKEALKISNELSQRIKDWALEMVGEDEKYPLPNDLLRETKATIVQGYNQAKAEIRSRINKIFEEK